MERQKEGAMKLTATGNEKWTCMVKGIKVFEEFFAGIFVVGMVFLLYGWTQFDQLSLPVLLQFLFVTSWIGIIGLTGAIALPLLFVVLSKRLCRN